MKSLLLPFLLVIVVNLYGQATGKIDYKHLGLSFTIPDGWMGQEAEMGYVMASIPGLILLIPHDQTYTVEQLRAQARAGLNEGNGTNLQLTGTLADLGRDAVGGEFAGTLEWQPARAYVIGMHNPYGRGLTILAMTTTDQYNDNYAGYAKAVSNSIQFRKPEAKEDIGEWKEWLKNVKLTYRESYSSISPGVDGMTGGGYNSSRNGGNGTWDITVGVDGSPVLSLVFNDGSTASYTLSYRDNKLYLDGERYFRIRDGDYAPNCN